MYGVVVSACRLEHAGWCWGDDSHDTHQWSHREDHENPTEDADEEQRFKDTPHD